MDGQKAKSALTMMRPSEMIGATAPGQELKQSILEEAGRYDPYRQQQHIQDAYLAIDPRARKTLEHESRHRMSALQRATGRDDPVALEIRSGRDGKLQSEEWKKLEGKKIRGQAFNTVGDPYTLRELTPLAYDTPEEELLRYVQSVDVPLKNVAINLKPEGPGFTPEDITAYQYNSVPYGKIPPPQERFSHPINVFDRDDYRRMMEEWVGLPREDRPNWIDWARQFYPEGVK